MSYVIDEIQFNTAEDADYEAFHSIKPSPNLEGGFMNYFKSKAGHNPGSPLGNRQVCEVCGQSGSECKGHPVVLDMSEDGSVFLSEFGVRIIRGLTSLICRTCKSIIVDSLYPNSTFDELLRVKIPDARKMCRCEGRPTIVTVEEQKIAEKDKEYEWRDGRRHEKKASRLVLSHGTVSTLRDLIQEVANRPAEPGEKTDFERIGLKKEYILGLFYNKMILQPSCIHPMTFKRGVQSGVDETTGMMQVYYKLYAFSLAKMNEQIQQIQRELAVGAKGGRFSGTNSHIAAADGKKGLYRGPAQAKRSRNTSRAVLTPNAYGHSGEIFCPRFITKNQQLEFVVSEHNRYYLQQRVGHAVSHFVVPMESSTLNAREMYIKISVGTELKLGDVVLKTIEDGDHVMFHRHPTLHRHSMISYRCYESSEPVIKLHESNTKGHNADFDGDEGNVSIGAKLSARIELQKIDAAYNLFGGRSGEPVVGIAYNGIVGGFILSTHNNIPPRAFKQLMDIITEEGTYDHRSHMRKVVIDVQRYRRKAQEYGFPYESGRTLISMLLPRGLYYERKKKITIKFGLGNRAETKTPENWNKPATHVIVDAVPYRFKMIRNIASFTYNGLTITVPGYNLSEGETLRTKIKGIDSVKIGKNSTVDIGGTLIPYTVKEHDGSIESITFEYKGVPYTIGLPQIGDLHEKTVVDVEIKDGIMLRGNLRSVDVSNKLITAISMIDRYKAPYFFVDRGYAMMSKYIDIFGLTISARDYVKLGESRNEVLPPDFKEMLELKNSEIQVLERNKISMTPATAERIENQITHKIDEIVSAVQEVLTDGPYRNTDNAAISYGSGARGTVSNIMSATSIVGQMYTVNRRFNPKHSRASYYADPDSLSIFDRSFIPMSYAEGLTPPAVMQVADPARAQALNTYLGTPESGKAARETELHQDGIHVNYMLSLVGRDGKIMDLLAGYGCNGSRVTYRKTQLGMMESPVDPIAVLHKIKGGNRN